MELLENLEPLLRNFWYVAILASLIFIIQTIMTFVGADGSDGHSIDIQGNELDAPFELFSFRNLINFLLGFSWTGISFYSTFSNKSFLIFISLLVGALFVYFFFIIINQIRKLAEDNTFQLESTILKTAEVYLTIPANKTGKGKILISVNGAVHELDAMTEGEEIKSGKTIKVVKIENRNILIVEKI
ncbi:MAG: NfeD family protein [Saprospiraceae bacterium]|nr:NfeD family protein [Saprospiraceae bacterium]MBK7467359.1 NfeD family protein [Saprospiraceae bacterium]